MKRPIQKEIEEHWMIIGEDHPQYDYLQELDKYVDYLESKNTTHTDICSQCGARYWHECHC